MTKSSSHLKAKLSQNSNHHVVKPMSKDKSDIKQQKCDVCEKVREFKEFKKSQADNEANFVKRLVLQCLPRRWQPYFAHKTRFANGTKLEDLVSHQTCTVSSLPSTPYKTLPESNLKLELSTKQRRASVDTRLESTKAKIQIEFSNLSEISEEKQLKHQLVKANKSQIDFCKPLKSSKPTVHFEDSVKACNEHGLGSESDVCAILTANNKDKDKDNNNNNNNNNNNKSCDVVGVAMQRLSAFGTKKRHMTCVNEPNCCKVHDFAELKTELNESKESEQHNEPQEDTAGDAECPMSSSKFKIYGYKLIDYISNYLETIDKRRVTPNIEPGYLKDLIAVSAPQHGESFASIMEDFESHIMAGITHWQHPRFHAYFPAGNAYPSILADMLSDAIGCVGFSWAASPACTELEIIMLDWMGKMIGLPDEFLCLSGGDKHKGGGVIQGSASECVLVAMLAARHHAMEVLRNKYPEEPDGVLLSKLTGYCSKEAHSCVEKAAMIGFIRMRALDTDDKHSLRGDTLSKAISDDIQAGFEPFLVSATLGTTSCCSFDNIEEIGLICAKYDIWMHVDAAYAGSALICSEFKHLIQGIELATSFNMNPNKWMLINFDCSLMWVKDRFKLTRAFVVDPLYLQHSFSDQAIDYRHWGIPLSRRFRSLKLWFVIRNYGIEGLQAYIRNHVKLAKLFEKLIREDTRFIITNQVVLGLVCFRLIGSNSLNQRLLSMINGSGKLHMVPASLNGRYVIRFCVCAQNACEADIHFAYKCISSFASELFDVIRNRSCKSERIRAISQQNTIDISSLAYHTQQQSLSADPLNRSSSRTLHLSAFNKSIDNSSSSSSSSSKPVSSLLYSSTTSNNNNSKEFKQIPRRMSPRNEAARHHMLLQRHSKHGTTLADCGSLTKTYDWTVPSDLRRDSPTNTCYTSEKQAQTGLFQQATSSGSTAKRARSPLRKQITHREESDSPTGSGSQDTVTTVRQLEENFDKEIALTPSTLGEFVDEADGNSVEVNDDMCGSPFFVDDDDDDEVDDDDDEEEDDDDDDDGNIDLDNKEDSIDDISSTNTHYNDNEVDKKKHKEGNVISLISDHDESNKLARRRSSATENADEAVDELVALRRRSRMSLRNKRKFFVHTTSDPRVYRVSISGDINAHKKSFVGSTTASASASASASAAATATHSNVLRNNEAVTCCLKEQRQPPDDTSSAAATTSSLTK